jgi:hypothetical protein
MSPAAAASSPTPPGASVPRAAPAQQRARRGSQCTHAGQLLAGVCARAAEAESAAPRRRHTQARAAPFTSRADHQKPTRSAPAEVSQFNSDTRVAPATRKGPPPERHEPRASRAQPASTWRKRS